MQQNFDIMKASGARSKFVILGRVEACGRHTTNLKVILSYHEFHYTCVCYIEV